MLDCTRVQAYLTSMKGLRFFFLSLLFITAVSLFAETAAEEHSAADSSPVHVIPVEGEIDRSLMVFLRRSIDSARQDGARHIIFTIDTFGGRVDSALQIASLIGSLNDITTIAYVGLEPEGTSVSWSAGALIAFSADRIYMAPGTSMGSASPIIQSAEGTVPADEKTVSAVRTQMAALAEKNNYPKAVALAMVDSDMELLEVYREDEVMLMTRSEFDSIVRADPDSPLREGPVVSERGKLLALTAGELERYGVSSGTLGSEQEVITDLGLSGGGVTVYNEPTSADRAVTLLTGSAVTSILILIGIIGLFIEISSPGFGVPGAAALVSFSILFAGNALLGTVGSAELLIFVLGIALLVIEIFLIPGFGIAGISGIALMIAGLVLSMQDFIVPTFSWEWDLLGRNVLLVAGNIVAGFIAVGVLAFLVPKYTPFKRLTLTLNQDAGEGYTAQEASTEQTYLGKSGTAVTNLRPSGKAEFEGEVLQVETSGDYIEKGAAVIIAAVNGNRIQVRRKL
jgi:membrane-bound serine protease (ClpP class)